MNLLVRPVEPQDNPQLETLVKTVLLEHGCSGPGFASSDPELARMYETYGEEPGSAYWVVVDETSGRVLGGGGFARLKGTAPEEGICELQKLYLLAELRGKGFGHLLIERCITEAAQAGYREMYLETVPPMQSAVTLYEKLGFTFLPAVKGHTGHAGCTIFMSRLLNEGT